MQADTLEALAATTRRSQDSFTGDAPDADWGYERAQIARGITGGDLNEELYEVKDTLIAAVRAGNDELVGRMVRAVFDAYVDRMTDRECGLNLPAVDAIAAVQRMLSGARA